MAKTQKMYLGSVPIEKQYLGAHLSKTLYSPLDPDAVNFLTAAGITDATISSAINTLVTTLKTDGIWSKMIAIYPFVGGTASTHKYNLVNPQDTDAAFRLTFGSGITHNANGITTSGTGAARTYIVTGTDTNYNDLSGGIYSRTSAVDSAYDTGAGETGSNPAFLISARIGANNFEHKHGQNTISSQGNSDGTGFYQLTRTSSTQYFALKNGSSTTYNVSSVSSYVGTFFVGGRGTDASGTVDSISSRNYAYAYYGEGLTSAEAIDNYDAVQAFQTALSRQV